MNVLFLIRTWILGGMAYVIMQDVCQASFSHVGVLHAGLTFKSQAGEAIHLSQAIDFEDVTNLPDGFYLFNNQLLFKPKVSCGVHFSMFSRGLYLEVETPETQEVHSVQKTYMLLGPMATYHTRPYESEHFLSIGLGSGLCITRLWNKVTRPNPSSDTTTPTNQTNVSRKSRGFQNIEPDSILIEGDFEYQYKLYLTPVLTYSFRLTEHSLLQLSYHQMVYFFSFEMHLALSLGLAYEIQYP